MEENATVTRRPSASSKLVESFLFKYGLKIIVGIVVVLVFLTAVQCSIKKPESPTWTTHLTVPAVNRTYLMPEIVGKIDQPGIFMDSTGEVMFSFEAELDTISVSDNLSTEDISNYVVDVLGQVTIKPDAPDPVSVNLSDYVSLVLDTIPDISFDILNDLPQLDKFNWAEVATGAIFVKVFNDFGIDLDTVIVQLIDLMSFQIISTVTFPPPGIPAGVTDSIAIGLGGRTISNLLRLQIHCHTPGGTMLSLDDKTLSSSISFGDGIIVSAAEAEIPQISKDFAKTVELSESNTILSAELESGEILLSAQNNTNISVDIDVTLPDFKLGGTPLAISQTLSPNSTDNINVDLFGYTFEPIDQTPPQETRIEIAALIDSTAPNMVEIDEYDTLRVTFNISNLSFTSMTGVIDSTQAEFDGIEVDLDLPKGFDSLQLVSAILVLEIENAVDFPGVLDLQVLGDGGQSLNLSGTIDAGNVSSPTITHIIDSSLSSFLDPVPNLITVNGRAYFGDGSTVGTVTADDYIFSRVTISSPLEVMLTQATFSGDTTSEKIDQDDIDLITDHLIGATFSSTIINHLPLGVSVEVYMDGDSTKLNADEAQLVIGPLEVDAGVVGAGNVVIEATESEVSLTLDSIDIEILENDTLYSTQNIIIYGSDEQPVKLSGTDYLTIRGVFEVEYKFDGEF